MPQRSERTTCEAPPPPCTAALLGFQFFPCRGNCTLPMAQVEIRAVKRELGECRKREPRKAPRFSGKQRKPKCDGRECGCSSLSSTHRLRIISCACGGIRGAQPNAAPGTDPQEITGSLRSIEIPGAELELEALEAHEAASTLPKPRKISQG